MLLVVVVLIFFLYDFRAGLDRRRHHPAGAAVRVRLPRSAERLGQPAFHRRDGFRHPGGWRGGDGGEHLPPDRAARGARRSTSCEIIKDAAAEVDRPLFYAVAVIVASFLPIYVLSGPSGTLFKPMADTMVFALIGSLIVTLTLLPVLCAWFMRKGVRERRNAIFEAIKSVYTKGLDFCLASPWRTTLASAVLLAVSLLLIPFIGAEFMPQLDEGALWVRATMPYTISFDESAKITPQDARHPELLSRSHHGRLGTGPPGRRHRFDRLLQRRVLCRPQALFAMDRRLSHQGRADRGHQQEARRLSRHHLQLHPAGGRRGRRGGDRPEKRAGRQGLRLRSGHAPAEGQSHQAGPGAGARHHAT